MTVERVLNDGVYSLTAEEIPGLIEQITNNLADLGFPRTARQSLEDFLRALHGNPSVSAVALVSTKTRISRPDLAFHVLMETAAGLQLEEDMDRTELVGGYYDRFSSALRNAASDTDEGYYGSSINIASPIRSSAVAFRDDLVRQFGVGTSAGVLVVAKLIRPES